MQSSISGTLHLRAEYKEKLNMKKLVSMILIAAVVVLISSSCDNSGAGKTSPPEENTGGASSAPPVTTSSPIVSGPPSPGSAHNTDEQTPALSEPEEAQGAQGSPENTEGAEAPGEAGQPTATESVDLSELKEPLARLWSKIDGSTATIPLTAMLCDAISDGDAAKPVHNTTPDAYWRLINRDNTDLIFVTYPSENEFYMAREKGVELEIIPVTKDALVFLVNADNPVDNIRLPDLQSVYTGGITNWRDLGGADESIIPYQRTAGSGSQTLFLKLAMGSLAPMTPPSTWVAEAMGALVEAVSNYDNAKGAIGYSMFYYVNNMYGNDRFKLLGIDGVKPTRETITQGQYPLEDYYYAVMRKGEPDGSPARKLVDWLLTDRGQALAVRAGYIPLRPIAGAEPDNSIDPIYLGDTVNSSGTGGLTLKTSVDDVQPVNGVRPPLSDLFYDGFNYVQYINSEIIKSLSYVDLEYWYGMTLEEQQLKRPFTGIPADYPNYEIYYLGALYICFADGNPFFNRGINFYIPLTEDISPYGTGRAEFTITYDYDRRLMPNVDLYTLEIDIPDSPRVSELINRSLESWTKSFPGSSESVRLLESFTEWYHSSAEYPYRLQPDTGRWRDYLSVNYVLQTYDGPSNNMPVVFTICFDMKTGKTVDLAAVLMDEPLDYSNSQSMTAIDFTDLSNLGYPRQEIMPEGYIPAAGSVITEAWIMYKHVTMSVVEPDGRTLQFSFWE